MAEPERPAVTPAADTAPAPPAGTGHAGERLARLWWLAPLLPARRLSAGLAITLADGLYLVAWPWVAAAASPLAVLLGLFVGARHPGFEWAVSESLPLLLCLVTLGTLSGHLGLLFLAGFALGDFLLYQREAAALARGGAELLSRIGRDLAFVRLPLLIQYGVLAMPLIVYPIMVKTLLRSLTVLPRLGRELAFVASLVIHAVLTGVLLYFWAQSAPLLIRPLFTWRDVRIPPEAISSLQRYDLVLVAAGVVAAVVRLALQGLTAFVPRYARPLDAIQARLAAAPPVTPLLERTPAVATVAGHTAITTLLLAGIYQSWVDGLALALLVAAIEAARRRLIPVPLGPWPRLVERLPLLVRLAGGFVLILYLSSALAPTIRSAASFRPLVVITGLTLLVAYCINPLAPRAQEPAR